MKADKYFQYLKGLTINFSGFIDDPNVFPHWLLQILGTQAIVETEAPAENLEEPHFYCQGDGLGKYENFCI